MWTRSSDAALVGEFVRTAGPGRLLRSASWACGVGHEMGLSGLQGSEHPPASGGQDLLDRLDSSRHDTLAILDAANGFGGLTDSEQDETEFDLWGHAGLDDAQHPLSALLRESNNQTCVVRDLDGTLQLLWQKSASSERWQRGPLRRGNLIDTETLEERDANDPGWLAAAGIDLSPQELLEMLAFLPTASGPLVNY